MTCKLTTIMSFEQNLKITCKLTINKAFDQKVWCGMRGCHNDADRGGELEHHEDLPGFKGVKYLILVAPIPITSTTLASPLPGFTWFLRWPYLNSSPTIYLKPHPQYHCCHDVSNKIPTIITITKSTTTPITTTTILSFFCKSAHQLQQP